MKTIRKVSAADSMAWAVAIDYDGVLATDEWPLRQAAGHVRYGDEEPAQLVRLMQTLDLVHLFEQEKRLTREQRIALVRKWIELDGEDSLLKGWRKRYEELFGEAP